MQTKLVAHAKQAVPLHCVSVKGYKSWLKQQSLGHKQWLDSIGFKVEEGRMALLSGDKGSLQAAVAILPEQWNLWHWAKLALDLPPQHHYQPQEEYTAGQWHHIALGWQLATYTYDRYKETRRDFATLVTGKGPLEHASQMAESIYLVRDLINTPTNDMGPTELAQEAKKLAAAYKAKFRVVVGDDLLKQNYPTIHAVGRACEDAPRLIDFTWGNPKHPKVTLVGKGVCFDTGGLNIKTGSNMNLMKKDMGGAAFTLGLARLIMQYKLPVRLRVMIPAVQNSISGNAFRPQDIITTRAGITVEIGNTDAEGRLILADALSEADEEKPDLLMDFATLTGASRIALGTDIPSFFTNDDTLAQAIGDISRQERDPLWRLPLWEDYYADLQSPFADINNAGGSYAGAITAALFMKKFVKQTPRWLHIDMMAWNLKDRPGRPVGGEAQGLRCIFRYIAERYGK
jgi:leucyl aminopeptidase